MTALGKFVDRQKLEAHFSPAITGKDAYTAGEVLLSIQKFPSADVAPVIHAHWIDDGYYADFHPHKVYRCSNCDWSKLDVELPEEKFCPDCGAKMDEVET